MNTEIEAKFVNVDHSEIRIRLQELGARLGQPSRDMKRVIIEDAKMKEKNAFIRIRDEGDKVTMTYKQFDELSVDGAKEIEVVVSNFQSAIDLLAAVGLTHTSYQESRRETWKLGTTEIVLDTWPWLNPYIEVEGVDAKTVQAVAEDLGFNWDDAVFGDVMAAYRVQYPHLSLNDTVGNLPIVRFNDPLPNLFISPGTLPR